MIVGPDADGHDDDDADDDDGDDDDDRGLMIARGFEAHGNDVVVEERPAPPCLPTHSPQIAPPCSSLCHTHPHTRTAPISAVSFAREKQLL